MTTKTDAKKIFKQATKTWLNEAFAIVYNDVVENLTGRVLRRDTGNLANSVARNSKIFSDGFRVGTNVHYGIAWELGSPETPGFIKETTIRPVKARALRIPVGSWRQGVRVTKKTSRQTGLYRARGKSGSGSMVIFRKRVVIPKRPIRPFLLPAFVNNEARIRELLSEIFTATFKTNLPDYKFEATLKEVKPT
jgi:hypothetical protein